MSIEVGEGQVTIDVGEEDASLISASSPTLTVDAATQVIQVLATAPTLAIETSASTIDLSANISVPTVEIGVPGPEGPPGPPGPPGDSGSSGRFFDYTYDPSMMPMARMAADPVPDGVLHFDTSDQNTATILYITSLTASGVDVSDRLAVLPIGVRLWVQDRGNSSMHATYILTGPPAFDIDMGMWAIPVSSDLTGSGSSLIPGESVLAGALDTGTGIPGPEGPAGPQGDPGPPGTAVDVSYIHYQSSAATVWTINHTLAFQPNITVVDSMKTEIIAGTVEYLTAATIRLTFSAPIGGEAYLS